jgi:hypothetical protein
MAKFEFRSSLARGHLAHVRFMDTPDGGMQNGAVADGTEHS